MFNKGEKYNMECKKEVVSLIHKYLDEEINEQERIALENHLNECPQCKKHMDELKRSIAFIQSSSHLEAPKNFTENVMKQLPKQKKSVNWKRWMRGHPFLVAASLFFILMTVSMFSAWSDRQNDLMVTGQANLVIDKERNVVLVPEGEIVEGDIVIRNGNIQVEGQVNGSVTVINGEKYLASAGHVAGDIKEINQWLDWLWFNIKSFFSEVLTIFQSNNE